MAQRLCLRSVLVASIVAAAAMAGPARAQTGPRTIENWTLDRPGGTPDNRPGRLPGGLFENRPDGSSASRPGASTSDQWTVGHPGGFGPARASSGNVAPLIFIAAILAFLAILGVAYRNLLRKPRPGPEAVAAFLNSLTPEQREELAQADRKARRLARKGPFGPFVFDLHAIEIAHNGFSLRASGVHRGRQFGFAISFTMFQGPVALCEWSRTGAESDTLLDILAEFADVPRGDRQFPELVKTSAIILQAKPRNVSFAQLTEIQSKIFFELAEGQPEILMRFDFAAKTGRIDEKDVLCREYLVDAFQPAHDGAAAG